MPTLPIYLLMGGQYADDNDIFRVIWIRKRQRAVPQREPQAGLTFCAMRLRCRDMR